RFGRTPEDMSFFLDAVVGEDKLDPFSFNLKKKFLDSELNEKEFSNIKICWLSNMNNKYDLEDGILDMCNNKLSELEKNNFIVDMPKTEINTNDLWKSWTCLRSKSIYNDTLAMNINNIEEMTEQAIWEYKKGSKINDDDINHALRQKHDCFQQVEKIFNKFDFIALPSAQIFPFDKKIQYPSKINNKNLDTYHRWLEVFILSSLLELPTMTIPIGFNKNSLPMGLQIIGKKGEDLKVYSFAKKYEYIFNFAKTKPSF
ncbi:MAG: amidase family protein, partial [Candidatus Pelagibacter sp.]